MSRHKRCVVTKLTSLDVIGVRSELLLTTQEIGSDPGYVREVLQVVSFKGTFW